jgi:hypothetical protein
MPAAVSRLAALSAISTFSIFLYCWHVFGFRIATSLGSHHLSSLPKYWSVSRKGSFEGLQTWKKPEGLDRVVALVFYGRPASVSILDCYLKVPS